MSGLIVHIIIGIAAFILALAIMIIFPTIDELFSAIEIAWAAVMAIFTVIFEIIHHVRTYVRTTKGRAAMTACPKCGSLRLDFSISTTYGEEKVIIKCYDCGEAWLKQ